MKKQTNLTMPTMHKLLTLHPGLMTRCETSVKVENSPYIALSVENIGLGPRGLPALSVTHYGEQNGDLMRDPEMCFEMEIEGEAVKEFHPYYFRNDYVGFEQFSVIYHGHNADNKPRCEIDLLMLEGQREFAATWDSNLAAQGFEAAFLKTCVPPIEDRNTLSVGDSVAYSVQFLASIRESHGAMAQARGTVTSREVVTPDFILLSVDWQSANFPTKVRDTNLARVGPNPRFCAC